MRTGDTISGVVRAAKNGEKYFALIKIDDRQVDIIYREPSLGIVREEERQASYLIINNIK